MQTIPRTVIVMRIGNHPPPKPRNQHQERQNDAP